MSTIVDTLLADNAVLRSAIIDYLECSTCHGAGVHWSDVGGEAEPEQCDMRNVLDKFIAATHPGAALMAELDAARAVVEQARRGFGTEADIERAYAFDPVALTAAIRRYDAQAVRP
jgi:hypothetical protein